MLSVNLSLAAWVKAEGHQPLAYGRLGPRSPVEPRDGNTPLAVDDPWRRVSMALLGRPRPG
ncbi:MAG: hypothetical protein F4226_01750 [Synechococcus sp. SB0678_bin_12]|nr:hypothetical protein [Synechococcus sp. SB0678_bin_12]